MDVILELSPENFEQFQQVEARGRAVPTPAPMIDQLTTTIDALNVIIKPQYRDNEVRGEGIPAENYYFVIETKDWEECQRIASTLDQLSAVEAAYCKPEAEPASLP